VQPGEARRANWVAARSSAEPVVPGAQFNLICAPRPMIVEEPVTVQIGGYLCWYATTQVTRRGGLRGQRLTSLAEFAVAE
jgi:hypothetical protein